MNWILGILPLLAVLACPLMMILMTFGMFVYKDGAGCHDNHKSGRNDKDVLQEK